MKDTIKVICPGCKYEFDVERDFLLKSDKLFCCNCTKSYDIAHFGQADLGGDKPTEEEFERFRTDEDPDGGYWD